MNICYLVTLSRFLSYLYGIKMIEVILGVDIWCVCVCVLVGCSTPWFLLLSRSQENVVTVGSLIESASAGWWVVERNGGGLWEQPERVYGKELRGSCPHQEAGTSWVCIKSWSLQ